MYIDKIKLNFKFKLIFNRFSIDKNIYEHIKNNNFINEIKNILSLLHQNYCKNYFVSFI
jgi:hypothetical protein